MSKYHMRKFAKGRTKKPGEMNKTEEAYSKHLEALRLQGMILWYRYEAITLKLAKNCTYKPDFLVMDAAGFLEAHEVKGTMTKNKVTKKKGPLAEADSIVKIKTAAEIFPMKFKMVWRDKGSWQENVYGD